MTCFNSTPEYCEALSLEGLHILSCYFHDENAGNLFKKSLYTRQEIEEIGKVILRSGCIFLTKKKRKLETLE